MKVDAVTADDVETHTNKVMRHLENHETSNTRERLSGREWLHTRLERGRDELCGSHGHAECKECHSVKCVGSDYDQYEEITQVCDCEHNVTKHMVVPFTNFGQHVGF